MQNCVVERLNGSNLWGVLEVHVFRNLTDAREQDKKWLADYNTETPH
jgi:putative transposase